MTNDDDTPEFETARELRDRERDDREVVEPVEVPDDESDAVGRAYDALRDAVCHESDDEEHEGSAGVETGP